MKNEIVKLLEDRDFVQKLMTREDVEDVKKLFKDIFDDILTFS